MRDLRLVSISEDRHYVVLRAEDTGEQFRVAAPDLRSALRGERARPGQLEIHMDSALRPRDIQARIRAGATPEEVADVAQVPVERIMGYAVPVLAEREHIVDRARLASVRRKHTDGPTRSLGDTVTSALHAQQVDPDAASWDSWRREDGRWVVTVAPSGEDSDVAHYTYDAQGRYVVAEDDAARRLIADEPRAEDPTTMAMVAAVQGPSSPAPVPLDAPDWSPEDCESPADAAAGSADSEPQGDGQPQEGAAVTRLRRRRPLHQVPEPLPLTDAEGEPDEDMAAEATGDVVRSGEPRRRRERRRASVPSWDEIMFGGGKAE